MKSLIVICLILIVFSFELKSQEVQVPMDDDHKVMVIDKELESKLALFTEYPGFEEARLFRKTDNSYILEITYKLDSDIMKIRKDMTEEEVKELRFTVTNCIETSCPTVLLDQEGRTEFLIGTTVLSLGYYGVTVPNMLGADESDSYVALYSLTSAAGFFVPYLITQNSAVPKASASLGIYGGISGIAHGMFLHWMFADEKKEVYYYDYFGNRYEYYEESDFLDPEEMAAVTTLFSIAELTAGFVIAKNTNMTEGTADVISSIATFGTLYGLGAQVVIDEDAERSSYGLCGLIGSAAGFTVGSMVANTQNYTTGDATVLSTAGWLGAYLPFSLYATVLEDDFEFNEATGLAMLGSIGGLVWGANLVKGYDFTSSQGSYIGWGTPLGGLLGFGIGYGIDPDSPRIPLLLSSAASITTFAILYNSYKKDAKEISFLDNLNVQVSPLGMAALTGANNNFIQKGMSIPVMNISYTF